MRQLAPVAFLLDAENKVTRHLGDEGVEKAAKLTEALAKTSSDKEGKCNESESVRRKTGRAIHARQRAQTCDGLLYRDA